MSYRQEGGGQMGAHAQRLHNGVLEQRALIRSILGVQVVSQRQTECPGQHHEGISPSFGGMFQQHWVCESEHARPNANRWS